MKRSLQRLCALVVLLALAMTPGTALAAGQYALITGGRLNLRAAGNASSALLGTYASGTWVEVLGATAGGWRGVRTPDGKTGYMSGNYLLMDNDTAAMGTVTNPDGYVNLRSGTSMNAQVLGQYLPGTQVEILAPLGNGWTQVRIGSLTGYMVSEFIQSKYAATPGRVTSRNGGRVNLRSGPTDASGVVTSLATGTSVTILRAGKDWHKISAGGYTGFMAARYVTTGSAAPGGSLTAVVRNPRATQVLNLRAQPSLDAKVLGYYRNGSQVRVISKGAVWCEVSVGDKHGYMMTQYLSFSGAGAGSVSEVATLYNPNGGAVVNMRAGASLYASIIGMYAVGTQATILQRGQDWSYVTIGAQSGYVSSYFLR